MKRKLSRILSIFKPHRRQMTLGQMLDYNLSAGYLALTWEAA